MVMTVAEVVEEAIKAKTNDEKVKILLDNDSHAIRLILKIMYDKSIKVLLPDTAPPYKPTTVEGCEGILHKHARKLNIFIEGGGYENLPQVKRENLFISLLEEIDPRDAQLLIKMIKQKRLTGLPKSVIQESYNVLPKTEE